MIDHLSEDSLNVAIIISHNDRDIRFHNPIFRDRVMKSRVLSDNIIQRHIHNPRSMIFIDESDYISNLILLDRSYYCTTDMNGNTQQLMDGVYIGDNWRILNDIPSIDSYITTSIDPYPTTVDDFNDDFNDEHIDLNEDNEYDFYLERIGVTI